MADKLEVGVPEMVHDVLLPSGEEIIDHDHAVSSRYQTVHEVRPHEPSSTRYDDSQPLPLQPQRNLTGWIARPEPEPVCIGELVLGLDGEVGDRIKERGGGVEVGAVRSTRGREDVEDQSGYGNAYEHKEEALLPEHVPDHARDRGPWFNRFR